MKASLWIDAMNIEDKHDQFGGETVGGDACTCGHSSEDHRKSSESRNGGPCSICTCNHFDWDDR